MRVVQIAQHAENLDRAAQWYESLLGTPATARLPHRLEPPTLPHTSEFTVPCTLSATVPCTLLLNVPHVLPLTAPHAVNAPLVPDCGVMSCPCTLNIYG